VGPSPPQSRVWWMPHHPLGLPGRARLTGPVTQVRGRAGGWGRGNATVCVGGGEGGERGPIGGACDPGERQRRAGGGGTRALHTVSKVDGGKPNNCWWRGRLCSNGCCTCRNSSDISNYGMSHWQYVRQLDVTWCKLSAVLSVARIHAAGPLPQHPAVAAAAAHLSSPVPPPPHTQSAPACLLHTS
jgi:hypothetical protein